MPKRSAAAHTDIEDLAQRLEKMCAHGEAGGVSYPFVEEAVIELRNLSNKLKHAEDALDVDQSKNMNSAHPVSQDERDAVQVATRLVRAINKWGDGTHLMKRAEEATDWLNRYQSRHPDRIFRGTSGADG